LRNEGLQDRYVVHEALAEVEMDGEDRQKLLADFLDAGTVGGLHGGQDELVKLVLVDGLVVHPVGGSVEGIGDTGTNFGGDGDGHALFGPNGNGGLSYLIGAVGGVNCIGLGDNCGLSGHGAVAAGLALSEEDLLMVGWWRRPLT